MLRLYVLTCSRSFMQIKALLNKDLRRNGTNQNHIISRMFFNLLATREQDKKEEVEQDFALKEVLERGLHDSHIF